MTLVKVNKIMFFVHDCDTTRVEVFGYISVRKAVNAVIFCKNAVIALNAVKTKNNSPHFTAFLTKIHRKIQSFFFTKFTASNFVAN